MRLRPLRPYNRVVTPTEDENRELIRRAQAGDADARDECVRRNAPLVTAILKRTNARYADWDDLFQEGLIGLDTAVMRFDLTRGTRLSTVADYWMRQKMQRWRMERQHAIRVPRRRQAECRGPASDGEPDDVSRARAAMLPMSSLDAKTGDGLSFADTLEARPEHSPRETAEDLRRMWDAIDKLGPRERGILVDRCLLGKTLEEIGDKLGVTKERVRQIQLTATRRLAVEFRRESA